MNIFIKAFILHKCATRHKLVLHEIQLEMAYLYLILRYIQTKQDMNENDRLSINNDFTRLMKEYPVILADITRFKCSNKNDKNYYQHQLCNTKGILSYIFQFLDLQSLIQCSLVHSIWLYDSFDPNSIYFYKLKPKCIKRMKKSWIERLSKIQSIVIDGYDFNTFLKCNIDNAKTKTIENFISTLKNLKTIKLVLNLYGLGFKELELLNNLLVKKLQPTMEKFVKIVQLNLNFPGCHDHRRYHDTDSQTVQNQAAQTLFGSSINCKKITAKNALFVEPDKTFGKITTSQEFQENMVLNVELLIDVLLVGKGRILTIVYNITMMKLVLPVYLL